MKVIELRKLAKEKGIKGYSKMRKAELEELLKEPTRQDQFIETLSNEIELITYKDKDQWIETRKLGIGGSDVSAIIGQSKYKCSYDIYNEKLYGSDFKGNRFTRFGHKLEPVVAECFAEEHKEFEVLEFEKTFKKGHSLANIDRLLYNKETQEYGVLECKTTSAYNYKEWEGNEVPQEYYCQVQHYLAVTGLKFAYICCIIGGNDYREFYIEKVEEECEFLLNACEKFWNEHIETEIPPTADGTSAYEKYQKERATKIETMDVIDLDDNESVSLEKELDELEIQIQKLEKEKNILKQKIIDKVILSGFKKARIGNKKVNWVTKVTTTLDKKKLSEVIDITQYETKKETGYFVIK